MKKKLIADGDTSRSCNADQIEPAEMMFRWKGILVPWKKSTCLLLAFVGCIACNNELSVLDSDGVDKRTWLRVLEPFAETSGEQGLLILQLRDETGARLVNGRLGTRQEKEWQALLEVQDVLDAYQVQGMVRVFDAIEEEQWDERRQGLQQMGVDRAPDLNSFFLVPVEDDRQAQRSLALARELVELPAVRMVHPVLRFRSTCLGCDGSRNLDPTRGELHQPHIADNPLPNGMEARRMWCVPGARGAGLKLYDLELGINLAHRELAGQAVSYRGEAFSANVFAGVQPDAVRRFEMHHGTAVAGLLAASNDGLGTVGMLPDAEFVMVDGRLRPQGSDRDCPVCSLARYVVPYAEAGDVLLLELSACTDEGLCVPMELDPLVRRMVSWLTASGVHVVEPAGNSGADLDAERWCGLFDRDRGDSGAVVVGATGADGLLPASFGNYGSRVDLHAAGEGVVTTGFGCLHRAPGLADVGELEVPLLSSEDYTDSFGGTSASAALVAGTLAQVVAAVDAAGEKLDPVCLRETLVQTGSAQLGGLERPIGTRPEAHAALRKLEEREESTSCLEHTPADGCATGGECPSGFCLMDLSGAQCARLCVADGDCEPGERCHEAANAAGEVPFRVCAGEPDAATLECLCLKSGVLGCAAPESGGGWWSPGPYEEAEDIEVEKPRVDPTWLVLTDRNHGRMCAGGRSVDPLRPGGCMFEPSGVDAPPFWPEEHTDTEFSLTALCPSCTRVDYGNMKVGGSNYTHFALNGYAGDIQDWNRIDFVIPHYHEDPSAIRAQLQAMRASGQEQIALMLWFCELGDPGRISQDHVVNMDTEVIPPPIQDNLENLLDDIVDAGYKGLVFRFGNQSTTHPVSWQTWDEDRYQRIRNFIFHGRDFVDSLVGRRIDLMFDLGVEIGGEDGGPFSREYTRRLARDYYNTYGKSDTCGFTIIYTSWDMHRRRIQFAREDFDPDIVAVDMYYHMEDVEGPNDPYRPVFTKLADDLQAAGMLSRPLVLQETFYNDATVGQRLLEAMGEGRLNFSAVFQWSLTSDPQHGGQHFDIEAPLQYDNYLFSDHMQAPVIIEGGTGCDDDYCIWLRGAHVSAQAHVDVRQEYGDILQTFSGYELGYTVEQSTQLVTFRVDDPELQRVLRDHGLRVWVVNPEGRYSIGYKVVRPADAGQDEQENPADPVEPAPAIIDGGTGCDDNYCIWIRGVDFSPSACLNLRQDYGAILRSYCSNEFTFSDQGARQVITFRVDDQELQAKLREHGLRIWVVNPDGQYSDGYKVFRPAD